MSAGKWTPGPWKAKGSEVYCGRLRVCSHVNAADSSLSIGDSVDRGHANARLISAAPDLLEALEKIWPFVQEDDGGFATPAYQDAINGVRNAIKKARGES